MKGLAILLLGVLLSAQVTIGCPEGFLHNAALDWCYLLVTDPKSITEAEAHCQANGDGHVAGVHSQAEDQYITGILIEAAIPEVFIGFNFNETIENSLWFDGTPVDYHRASKIKLTEARQCLSIRYKGSTSEFNRVKCDSPSLAFMCSTYPQWPVDGMWADWNDWNDCSVTCGEGTQFRNRSCTNPEQEYAGLDCIGDAEEVQICDAGPCPVDGGLSEWSAWGSCSMPCGPGGTKERTRTCTNPTPMFGGTECPGEELSEEDGCFDMCCPVNGGLTEWTGWTDCSVTCGFGTQGRSKSCTNPTPLYGGAGCSGIDNEVVPCDTETLCGNCAEVYTEDTTEGHCSFTDASVTAESCLMDGGELDAGDATLCIMDFCEEGWTYDSNGGSCYLYNSNPLSWFDAEDFCRSREAHLTGINSAEEQEFLSGFAGERIFFGLNDQAEEGTWVNADGSPNNYENWNGGEPNNAGNEDCGELLTTFKWNDIPCGAAKPSICEKRTFRYIECPDGYFYLKYTEQCYKLIDTPMKYPDAVLACAADAVGGEVTPIDRNFEVEHITDVVTPAEAVDAPFWTAGCMLTFRLDSKVVKSESSATCAEEKKFICRMTPDQTPGTP